MNTKVTRIATLGATLALAAGLASVATSANAGGLTSLNAVAAKVAKPPVVKRMLVHAPMASERADGKIHLLTNFWSDHLPSDCLERQYEWRGESAQVGATTCRYVREWRYQIPGKAWTGWGHDFDENGRVISIMINAKHPYIDTTSFGWYLRGDLFPVGTKFQVRVRPWTVTSGMKASWGPAGLSPVSTWNGRSLRPVKLEPAGNITKVMPPMFDSWRAGGLTNEALGVDFYSNTLSDSCLLNQPPVSQSGQSDPGWTSATASCQFMPFWRYRNPGGEWSSWFLHGIPGLDAYSDANSYGLTGSPFRHYFEARFNFDDGTLQPGVEVQAQVRAWQRTGTTSKWVGSWDSPVTKINKWAIHTTTAARQGFEAFLTHGGAGSCCRRGLPGLARGGAGVVPGR